MIRRHLHAALAAAFLAGTTAAQAHCSSAAEQSAFEVGALKSELSVLAVACGEDDSYNHFVERDRSELIRADGVVNGWFKRTFGRSAQAHYDSYITTLANEQSIRGQHEGSDYCPRLKPVFAESMVVPVSALPQYAAAKDLFPIDMACEASASQVGGSSSKGGSTRAPSRHSKK